MKKNDKEAADRQDEKPVEKDSSLRGFVKRRRERYQNKTLQPLAPLVCRVAFIAMILCTVLSVIGDVVSAMRYWDKSGLRQLLSNATLSAFLTWLIVSLLLLPSCFFQLAKIRREHISSGGSDLAPEKNSKYVFSPKKEYEVYSRVSIIGLVVLAVVMLLFRG